MKDFNTLPDKVQEYCNEVLNIKRIAHGTYEILAVKRFLKDLEREDLEFRDYHYINCETWIQAVKLWDASDIQAVVLPFQAFYLYNILAIFWKGTKKRKYHLSYYQMARKNNKALALHTKIPTPDGWATIKDIKVGDLVIGDDGEPVEVSMKSEIFHNKCYSILFEDGETIVADAGHLWGAYNRDHKRKGLEIKTTEELSKHYKRVRPDGKGTEYLWRVPMNKAIQLPSRELLIDPYTLGLWLGDGDSRSGVFTVHKDDFYMYDFLKDSKYKYKTKVESDTVIRVKCTGKVGGRDKKQDSLTVDLKELGVLCNKHIPSEYLRGSIEQRLALLQGLMDTDGSVSKSGQCSFAQKSKLVTDGFCELLSSLGIKYSRVLKDIPCNDKICQAYFISFYTDKSLPCFKLKRKYDRLKDKLNNRMNFKSIIDITEIESEPTQCIRVENENHMFLAGERMTVTHNSGFQAQLQLYMVAIDDPQDVGQAISGRQVLCCANSKDQGGILYDHTQGFSKVYDPGKKLFTPFKHTLELSNGSYIKVLSAEPTQNDGYKVYYATIDEYHASKTSGMLDVLRSSTSASINWHITIITTAGFDLTSPCYEFRNMCIDILNGLIEDDSIFALIFEPDEDDDWLDEAAWEKANPTIDVIVQRDNLKTEATTSKSSPSQLVNFKTKNLNLWCDSAKAWVPMEKWKQKEHPNIKIEDYKDRICYAGIDLATASDFSALSYVFLNEEDPSKGFTHIPFFFIPEETLQLKKQFIKQWADKGYIIVTPGNATDFEFIENKINQINLNFGIKPKAIMIDPFQANSMQVNLTRDGYNVIPHSQGKGVFNKPTTAVELAIIKGLVEQDGNPVMSWMVRNVCIAIDANGNQKPDKQKSSEKIDGVISMIQAIGGAIFDYENKKPEPKIMILKRRR